MTGLSDAGDHRSTRTGDVARIAYIAGTLSVASFAVGLAAGTGSRVDAGSSYEVEARVAVFTGVGVAAFETLRDGSFTFNTSVSRYKVSFLATLNHYHT